LWVSTILEILPRRGAPRPVSTLLEILLIPPSGHYPWVEELKVSTLLEILRGCAAATLREAAVKTTAAFQPFLRFYSPYGFHVK
jgi:hypothetical protein